MHAGIVHYAAPPVVGGVELTIFHHARVLAQLGHQVTVVAGRGAPFLPEVAYREEPLVGSRGPLIAEANRALDEGRLPSNFEDLVARLQAVLLAHLGACDVIVGHNLFTLHKNLALTAAVYGLVRAGAGPPWVAWHHDFAWLRPEYRPALHPGDPWALLKRPWPGVRHVTVSAAQRADLARLYGIAPEEIAVISPGVEPTSFYRCGDRVIQAIRTWDLLEADCLFLVPARITRRKNIELALRWLAAVREYSGWDARLIVTGPPGPHNPANVAYLDHLLAVRDELGLTNVAHFVYAVDGGTGAPTVLGDDEVAALYQLADALFFPSGQEGFGIPILEAGLARLPIFATDLPPFRESAGVEAVLFSQETPLRQVARTIVESLESDRAFRLRRRVLDRFTWKRVIEQHVVPLLAVHAGQR